MLTHFNPSTLEKIVKEQIEKAKTSIILAESNDGIKVNNLLVRKKDDVWAVFSKQKTKLSSFRNKRIAVLYAAAFIKKNYFVVNQLERFDTTIFSLKNDIALFENKISKEHKVELFSDRLSRSSFELDSLNQHILNLEKSVGLQ